MFWAALISFAPVLMIFVTEWVMRSPAPYDLAMLWTFLFPVAVGYGIVRRQLFEMRNVARSSAAYGAATLAITGVFAFLITFADAAVSRLNISFRWFQVTFLFFAILAFNPLRNRLQNLVDRFFDRDRERSCELAGGGGRHCRRRQSRRPCGGQSAARSLPAAVPNRQRASGLDLRGERHR
jgi:hypothetical protein